MRTSQNQPANALRSSLTATRKSRCLAMKETYSQ